MWRITQQNPYILYTQENAGHNAAEILKSNYEMEAFIYQFIMKNMKGK